MKPHLAAATIGILAAQCGGEHPPLQAVSTATRVSAITAPGRSGLVLDRSAYELADRTGHGVAFFSAPTTSSQHSIEWRLDGAVIATHPGVPGANEHVFSLSSLSVGTHSLAASKIDILTLQIVELVVASFDVAASPVAPTPFPSQGIELQIHSVPAVLGTGVPWPTSLGIPIPKGTLENQQLSSLVLRENGSPVPAQFTARATWDPGGLLLRWVGVDFVARFDSGVPRQYKVHLGSSPTPAHPVTYTENPAGTEFIVSDGTFGFKISTDPTAFNGLHSVWIDRNNNQIDDPNEYIIGTAAGVVSKMQDTAGNAYELQIADPSDVSILESGDTKITFLIHGHLKSATGAAPGAEVFAFLSYYSDTREIRITSRIVNMIDERQESRRLRALAWSVPTVYPLSNHRIGVDGATVPLTGSSESILQARHDQATLVGSTTPLGSRADGWVSSDLSSGTSMSLWMDNFWKRFPNEIRIEPSGAELQPWPGSGSDTFSLPEELARTEIYKFLFALEGPELDLTMPSYILNELQLLNNTETFTSESIAAATQSANGQGVTFLDRIVFRFDKNSPTNSELENWSRLNEIGPLGSAVPSWNAASLALGLISAPDAVFAPEAERFLETAYQSYRAIITDGGEEYGRWVFGGIHNNWEPSIGAASLKRPWQSSHYQNVSQAWLLFFRDGRLSSLDWARDHHDQYSSVGVRSYLNNPTHGDVGGKIVHGKGYLPWHGETSTRGHWVDIESFFLSYYMTGDPSMLPIADKWIQTQTKTIISSPKTYPCDQSIAFREDLTTLGEMSAFYFATHEPESLIYMNDLASILDPPNELSCSADPTGHPHFSRRWQHQYFEVTRDSRTTDRIQNWFIDSYNPMLRVGPFASFLYERTGATTELERVIARAVAIPENAYYESSGPLFGYGTFNTSASAARSVVDIIYLLGAARSAGLSFDSTTSYTSYPVQDVSSFAVSWFGPSSFRGLPKGGSTILAGKASTATVAVSIRPAPSFGDPRGEFRLFDDFPELLPTPNYQTPSWSAGDALDVVSTTGIVDLTNQIGYSRDLSFPLESTFLKTGWTWGRLQHLTTQEGAALEAPVFADSMGGALSEASVVPRARIDNGQSVALPFWTKWATRLYMRPLDLNTVITLTISSVKKRYDLPTRFRISDGMSTIVADESVFMHGTQSAVTVTLDPAVHPHPWLFETYTSGDYAATFTGAPELLFGVDLADLNSIASELSTRVLP